MSVSLKHSKTGLRPLFVEGGPSLSRCFGLQTKVMFFPAFPQKHT